MTKATYLLVYRGQLPTTSTKTVLDLLQYLHWEAIPASIIIRFPLILQKGGEYYAISKY
jgi:hypothetical protein